jgi:hypothetical protein
MKKNWIRIAGTLTAFAGACALVWGISAPGTPAVSDVTVKPGTQVAHLLRSDYRHPEPVPVVEVAPAPVEEVYVEPPYVPGGPGDAVPFVASSDPNNASGGDYLDPGSYCQSGSASGYPPYCA